MAAVVLDDEHTGRGGWWTWESERMHEDAKQMLRRENRAER